ncbi:hypothetical protein [Rhizobium sp. 007]|uniref:hypothetical protein n=1 Tax=Rhizobium sp. 007 TaxID=2785056 RepID=UPI00188FE66D|nr:hypothetical protein [Rhizobium sp. 007]QPB24396.1 hypothetical protein ISN39_33195 [Rhizobium sp. 007]
MPANLITEESTAITPQMLPLIDLTQEEIDRIVATVPAASATSRTFMACRRCRTASCSIICWPAGAIHICWSRRWRSPRGLLDRYLGAVQQVVDRHDILRTAFVWEGLSSPAQVVSACAAAGERGRAG